MAESSANSTWQRWKDEHTLASKARGYKTWQTRAKKIVKRYRDDRASDGNDAVTMDGGAVTGARFNILWSNVQTLLPALVAKPPKPVVERRYLDRDDVGRTASVILERALLYEIDNGSFHPSVRRAVLDRLLPGRGVVWVRYEPKFSPMPVKVQGDVDAEAPDAASAVQPDAKVDDVAGPDAAGANGQADTQPDEEVAYECTPVDYIDWQDFKTSVSRTWEEVWWIDKVVYMTRDEMKARKFKCWDEVPLDWSPEKAQQGSGANAPATGTTDEEKRAKIHETWCKKDRKVYWWADGWSDQMLDEKEDPLQLEGFWPTPKPLFATLTNDSLVPVPDYIEYQDQAVELDDLTTRISALTKTIKACGVYDSSVPELQRMFEEGFENKLVPADNMAEFSSKAGADGMGHLWLLPVKDMVFTLNELYKARAEVKQSLYEITGISDIVRGAQDAGGTKTATEQRIKGQFASMRLNEMQADVARFARDVLRIMGEIISEHYDPMTLYLVSGYEQYAKEQFKPEPVKPPPPAPGAQPGMMPPDPAMLQQQAEQVARQKAAAMFKAAVELLKNDKLRGFRIDIETDSMIEPDQQATQQARTELLGAVAQFLPQAIQAGGAMPELKPLLARLLMFFLRGFKASRDIESAFEQFIDDMTREAANPQPKPPSPEEIKAKAEMDKAQMENQRMQAQAQIDQQKGQQDLAIAQAKNQMDMQKMQAELEIKKQELMLDQQRLALEERQMQLKAQVDERTAQIKADAGERQAALDAENMDRQSMADQQKHDLGLEVMEAKAAQAKKPNGGATA